MLIALDSLVAVQVDRELYPELSKAMGYYEEVNKKRGPYHALRVE